MRISDSVLTNMVMGSMGGNYDTYVNTIQKIVSNKNFSKVSENPTDATKVLKLDNQISQLNIYQSNIEAATNEMNYTYDTLGGMQDELSAINSLIVEAANASTSPESAKAIATEISERVKTVQDKLNAKYLDNYIFSGTFTGVQAFQTVGDDIVYKGSSTNAGDRKLTIAEGMPPFVFNIAGDKLFGEQTYYLKDDNGDTQPVTSDFFSQMKDLNTLLNADTLDYDKIREKLQVTNQAITNVTQQQGTISAQVSKLDTTKNLNESTILNLTENKADLEEVDIIKAASDLANAQTAMQASYLLGTRVLNNVSLLDYL
ncbi:MAG: hypothetical protein IJ877_03285 [Candidatus Gastranaerophilales bacterium]|nr:hypothetical protein [Candidatus Gastranaerophilales bacterium]